MDYCTNCGERVIFDTYDSEWTHHDGMNECTTTRDTTYNPNRDYATPTES